MKKLFDKMKVEALSIDEKSKMTSEMQNFVTKNITKKKPSPYFGSPFFLSNKLQISVALLLFIFTATFGTAFASNSSLPGDMLYPIKLLTENIQTMTTIGSRAHAKVLTDHAIIRLKEAEDLADSGRLDTKTRKQIEVRFENQADEALKNIDELKNTGDTGEASKINSDFQDSLNRHQKTISQLSENDNTEGEIKKELNKIIFNVNSQIEKTQRIHGEIKKSTATSTEEMMRETKDKSDSTVRKDDEKRTDQTTKNVEDNINNQQSSNPTATSTDTERIETSSRDTNEVEGVEEND